MTDDIKVTADQIKAIEGMENYEESSPSVPYIKILNGSAAIEANLEPGTIISLATQEALAKKDEDFKFMPIYYFKRWTIWDNRSLVKFTFDKKGMWSDGSAIEFEEVNWSGNNPPKAQESMEFVILPISELKKPKDEQKYSILSFGFTNKIRIKAAKQLEQLIFQTCINEKVTKMYACVFSVQSKAVTDDKKNTWFDFQEPKFIQKVKAETLALGSAIYTKVKDINKVTAIAVIEPQLCEESMESMSSAKAEVMDNTEF